MSTKSTPINIRQDAGALGGQVETHPSYGMVRFSRITGKVEGMFGTDIVHNSFIELTVCDGAERRRSISNDWYYSSERRSTRAWLTEAQFAALITNMNAGSGTPCTLRTFNGEELPMAEPTPPIVERFKSEVTDTTRKFLASLSSIIEHLDAMVEGKESSNKKNLTSLAKNLRNVAGNLPNNLDFVEDQMKESMEHLYSEAVANIEAYVGQKLMDIGHNAIVTSKGDRLLKEED